MVVNSTVSAVNNPNFRFIPPILLHFNIPFRAYTKYDGIDWCPNSTTGNLETAEVENFH